MTPRRDKQSGGGGKVGNPYTALFASALSLGIDFAHLVAMPYGLVRALVEADADMRSAPRERGGKDGSRPVRDATQADIKRFLS